MSDRIGAPEGIYGRTRMVNTFRSVEREFDYDWLIIGSGFGGSVSALRLAEKGYSVGVLESGRRFNDEDFAKSGWDMRRYFWAPGLGMRGIFRLTVFKDVFIASGAGVGGGSLGYANTLYRPGRAFFEDPQWRDLADWEQEMAPHYDSAEYMLGVSQYEGMGPADLLLKEMGEELGVGETFKQSRVGVFFGPPDEEVADPFFGGAGPTRTGCTRCGNCMIGCRVGAKNTLVKNYLWFAEQLGAEVLPERQATDINPLGDGDGSDGYEISTAHPGAWLRKRRRTFTARNVVVSAGALGTNELLANCKHRGGLPNLSDRLGHVVRTNSESIQAVTAPNEERDFSASVAISSSVFPDPDTHIEVVTYGKGGDVISRLFTLASGNGTRITRPLRWIGSMARHPLKTLRLLWPVGWSKKTVILLTMQTTDSAMRLVAKRRLFGGVKLQTEQDPERPNPTFIPAAERATKWFEQRIGGIAQGGITEAFNIPTTAHILGGAPIGLDPEHGVVDSSNRAFGYEGLLICDGSAIPANPGVNPSLSITAMTERAMSLIPPKTGAEQRQAVPEIAAAGRPV